MFVRRIELIYQDSNDVHERPCDRVLTAADAAAALTPFLRTQLIEVLGVLCLSTRRDVIGYHEVSRGTLDGTIVHPREVFKPAILANAAAVIVGHNHPSGDPAPSHDDHQITRRLMYASRVLGIEMLDHIVIGAASFFSFSESGHLSE